MAVLILLLIMVATLAQSYRSHRAEALALSLTLLGEQFAERVQRLHGLWLDQRRPAVLHADGVAWQFDARGWPLGVDALLAPSENCRQLWSSIISTQSQALPPLQAMARIARQITPIPVHASGDSVSPRNATLITATSSGAVPRISG